jgi:tRNA(Ile)-lysidine synthase
VPLAELNATSPDLGQIFSNLIGFDRLALAVSGGSDSMAMLLMVCEWVKSQPVPPEIYVLTVDHGLRESSGGEAQKVLDWSMALGLRCEILCWEGLKPHTGIQANARRARYDLMTAWCLKHNLPALLTAHTADDQAETFLMRSARTSSAKSLAGIWPERDWNGIRVLRPMLKLRHAELQHYLKQNGQNWIEDPSNLDERFERVRIRKTLAGNSNNFAAEAAQSLEVVLQSQRTAQKWCDVHLDIHETGLMTFFRDAFENENAIIQDEIVLLVIKRLGLLSSPERQKRLDLAHWLTAKDGTRRGLGGVIFAKRARDILAGREPSRISAVPLVIPNSGWAVWDNRFRVVAPAGASVISAGQLTTMKRRKDIPAFIQAGLPVVMQNGFILAVPLLGIGSGADCEFVTH